MQTTSYILKNWHNRVLHVKANFGAQFVRDIFTTICNDYNRWAPRIMSISICFSHWGWNSAQVWTFGVERIISFKTHQRSIAPLTWMAFQTQCFPCEAHLRYCPQIKGLLLITLTQYRLKKRFFILRDTHSKSSHLFQASWGRFTDKSRTNSNETTRKFNLIIAVAALFIPGITWQDINCQVRCIFRNILCTPTNQAVFK